MKVSLESLAIIIVAILSMIIVSFIIWYNFIETEVDYRIPEMTTMTKKVKEVKEKAYLDNMENYEDTESLDDGDLDDDTNSIKIEDKNTENFSDLDAELEDIIEN